MDGLKTDDLGRILGLFSPWTVKSTEFDERSNSLVIELTKSEDRKRFGLIQPKPAAERICKRWHHVPLGRCRCQIEVNLPASELAELRNGLPPAFLGTASQYVTRELADRIRLAHSAGLHAGLISELLGLSTEMAEAEIRLLEAAQAIQPSTALLPLESSSIWLNILTDTQPLSTTMLPLKLLLSRLKLDVAKDPGRALHKSVLELRTFFVLNSHQLTAELNQLGVYPAKHTQAGQQKQKLKLILPGSGSHLWHQLLTGERTLKTESMPLKLCLAQQKRAYRSGPGDAERAEAIRNLQQFFRHNAQSLVSELKTLTGWARQQPSSPILLPAIEHQVWQSILLDDQLLASEKINYRLLVSRLKNKYRRTGDRDCLLQLRDFFNQNASTMAAEIQTINRLADGQ
ncbi:hypothetical protein [Reinekea marinisedimentorum]|uniref:Uncharacterized protein n=1 Tax=Reinekea marinisedimentorum TaxID=230495 RepID=A0A4R3IBB4_9GAMM|nr:hypothetical protein [Reinekea marinisedimentorum]TCS43751.1 hypothetical protein BCF53_10194 [Reinekea marinisedimentorum]